MNELFDSERLQRVNSRLLYSRIKSGFIFNPQNIKKFDNLIVGDTTLSSILNKAAQALENTEVLNPFIVVSLDNIKASKELLSIVVWYCEELINQSINKVFNFDSLMEDALDKIRANQVSILLFEIGAAVNLKTIEFIEHALSHVPVIIISTPQDKIENSEYFTDLVLTEPIIAYDYKN